MKNLFSPAIAATFLVPMSASASLVAIGSSNGNEGLRLLDINTGITTTLPGIGITLGLGYNANTQQLGVLRGQSFTLFDFSNQSLDSPTTVALSPSGMNISGGLDYDPVNNRWIGVRSENSISPSIPLGFYEIDPNTGNTSLIMSLTNRYDGMDFNAASGAFIVSDNTNGLIKSTTDFINFTTIAAFPAGITTFRGLAVADNTAFLPRPNGDVYSLDLTSGLYGTTYNVGAFSGTAQFGAAGIEPIPAPAAISLIAVAGLLANRRKR